MERPAATGRSVTDDGPRIAVLFARSDSHYSTDPRCEHFDIERDARTWIRGSPIVAHPPCRAWGRLKHFAKPRPDEKALGLYAVSRIWENGGVLEHPAASSLWKAMGLPRPGEPPDFLGGYTLELDQFRWGHPAEKLTWFYICGVPRERLPEIPPRPHGRAPYVVTNVPGIRKGHPRWRPEMRKAAREVTPPALADWLIRVAQAVEGPPLERHLESGEWA